MILDNMNHTFSKLIMIIIYIFLIKNIFYQIIWINPFNVKCIFIFKGFSSYNTFRNVFSLNYVSSSFSRCAQNFKINRNILPKLSHHLCSKKTKYVVKHNVSAQITPIHLTKLQKDSLT